MIKWFGIDICNAGFLINLEERNDRYLRSVETLSECNITGVERFNAVVINDSVYHKYGCTESHIQIAKLQIENNWDYVLYLEDDIIEDYFYNHSIPNHLINKEKVTKSIIKDFKKHKPDILWLGTRLEDYTSKFSNFLVKPKKTIMAHGYIGSLKFANFLVNHLKYRDQDHFSGGWPIDFFMSQIVSKDDWRVRDLDNDKIIINNDLKVFVSIPMIFNQGKSHSNLTDNFVSYEGWVRGCFNKYADINKLKIKTFLNE
jgi:GR25 family glycosyltransferase involved in LPS biosynthesis